MNEPIWGIVGIAHRAGKITSGYTGSLKLVQGGRGKLVLLARDASDNTKKVFYDKGKYYGVPVYQVGSIAEMGNALGKGHRAVLVCSDAGFSKSMIKILEGYKDTM